MKKRKFTFKTHKETGMYSSFYPTYYDIKYKKIVVGSIRDRPMLISFISLKNDIMEDGNPNCKWMWKTLTYEPTSIDDAKEYVNNNIEEIFSKFNIYIDETNS